MYGTDAAQSKNPWRRWVRFWFTPADPTTMGFIRLVAGCLALYTHLAYSFDLQAFFGPNAWYGLAEIDRERKSTPHLIPALGWDDDRTTARVPDYPHRRAAVMNYLRELGTRPPAQVAGDLRWMQRLVDANNGIQFAFGTGYVLELSPNATDRAVQLGVVRDEKTRAAADEAAKAGGFLIRETPYVVVGLPPEQRAKAADEIEACYTGLPADPTERRYVVDHLRELDPTSRRATVKLMHDLPGKAADQRQRELAYLEDWGIEERLAGRLGNPVFSIWFHVTDPAGMAAAHGCVLVVLVLFAAGLWTRVTSVLAWLAAVSYIHRCQQVLFGMDTMLNILLFYLMFADSGAALSLDRVIKRYRAAKQSLARTGGIDAPTAAYLKQPPVNAACGFAQRLIQVHFCFIYMASGLSKLKGGAWWDHRAYWDTLANPEFTLIHYRWYESLVQELVSHRPLFALASAFGILVTFGAEIGLPFVVWTRKRPYILVLGFFLHAGIAVFMGLWIFSLLMMTMLLSYLPGAAIRTQLFGGGGGVKARLKLTGRDAATVRKAALVKALDFDDAVDVGEAVAGDPPAAVRAALPWVGRVVVR